MTRRLLITGYLGACILFWTYSLPFLLAAAR